VNNGQVTGWEQFTVTAPPAQLPTLTVHPYFGASAGQSLALTTLVTITDPDNVGYQNLELWDSNGAAASGQFVSRGGVKRHHLILGEHGKAKRRRMTIVWVQQGPHADRHLPGIDPLPRRRRVVRCKSVR
jgi:hypothetical protein